MRLTISDFNANESELTSQWAALKKYTLTQQPDLLVLPEMPFCNWVASTQKIDEQIKTNSIASHKLWIDKLDELEVRYIVSSAPVLSESKKYYNTAFVYEKGMGLREIHTKTFFPEEPHFWEESWFDRPAKEFNVLELDGFKIGVLLCTEMWFTEYARQYGKQGIDLLLCPRATGAPSTKQWIRLGQTLAVLSGAFCASANKSGYDERNQFQWGGHGWVAAPGNGELLGTTAEDGFFTVDIDLEKARRAKQDYPLYVKEK